MGKEAAAPGRQRRQQQGQVTLLAIAVSVLTVRWLFLLWWHPFGPCWRCGGTGKNLWSNSKRHGLCKRCKGSGRRLRVGARLFHKSLR
jgi:hypothetical protein